MSETLYMRISTQNIAREWVGGGGGEAWQRGGRWIAKWDFATFKKYIKRRGAGGGGGGLGEVAEHASTSGILLH